MSTLLDMARECGMTPVGQGWPQSEQGFVMSNDQLTALESRIRADEREKISARAKARYDYEVKAAAHHASRWYAAYDWHMTRQSAMADMLDAIRVREGKA